MATNSTVQTKLADAIQDLATAIREQDETARQLAQDRALLTQSQTTLPPNQLAPLRALVTAAEDHDRQAGKVIEGMQALVGALRAGAPDNVIQDVTGRITDSILMRTHAKQTYDIAKRSTPGAASAAASAAASTPAIRQLNQNKRERVEKELTNLRKKNLTGYIPTQRNQVLFRIQ